MDPDIDEEQKRDRGEVVMNANHVREENIEPKEASFDEAIAAAGWGKFHVLLYLAVIPAAWASSFDTSTSSMIAPSAECDLGLSLFQKGVLNAAVYGGMVSSAILWGFVADTVGRKPIVFYGYLLDGIVNALSGLAQNFYVLAASKFLCGFIVSGPHASIMTYCAEFHCTKDRPKIGMVVGFFVTSGSIVGAALALLIIPQKWFLDFGNFEIHSWQIYLIVIGSIIISGATCLGFFPESPKFLQSQGRSKEAHIILKKIHSFNSGSSHGVYPIQTLKSEKKDGTEPTGNTIESRSWTTYISDGLQQMKPLFVGSYLPKLLLVMTIQFCGMLSNNTIRLWQPQLFAYLGESTHQNDTQAAFSFCNIVDESTLIRMNKSVIENFTKLEQCKSVDNYVYTNTIIISAASLFFTFIGGSLLSIVENKYLLLTCFLTATCSTVALNWSNNVIVTLVLISLVVGSLRVTVSLVVTVVLNLFPTTMRTMAVSLTMMSGRLGSLLGNILFPIFLEYGCTVALISLAGFVLVAFIMTIFIPKPDENLN